MAKNTGWKIAGLVAVLIGGYALAKGLVRKAIAKAVLAANLANGSQVIEQDTNSITVVDTDTGTAYSSYQFNGNDMAFPLSHDPSQAYDNVAKLQAYLLFANGDLEMPIDGRFGDLTAEAVLNETEGLSDYGYDADDYDYETVTQAYYNEVVIPELAYFIEAQ